jgi:hypothetical protein
MGYKYIFIYRYIIFIFQVSWTRGYHDHGPLTKGNYKIETNLYYKLITLTNSPSLLKIPLWRSQPAPDENLFSPTTLGTTALVTHPQRVDSKQLGPTIHQARRLEEMVETGLLRDPSWSCWQTYRHNPPSPIQTGDSRTVLDDYLPQIRAGLAVCSVARVSS